MLADMHTPLEPPSAPFAPRRESIRSFSSGTSPLLKDSSSLSAHYLPSKFSRPHSPNIYKRRKGEKDADDYIPKQGGGRDAFRSNEARIAGDDDEDDYDWNRHYVNRYAQRHRTTFIINVCSLLDSSTVTCSCGIWAVRLATVANTPPLRPASPRLG